MELFGNNSNLGSTSTPAKSSGLFPSFGTGSTGGATNTTFNLPTAGTSTGVAPNQSASNTFGTPATNFSFGNPSTGTGLTVPNLSGAGTFGGFGSTNTGITTPAIGMASTSLGSFGAFGTNTNTATNTSGGINLFGNANTSNTAFKNFAGTSTGGVMSTTNAGGITPFGSFGAANNPNASGSGLGIFGTTTNTSGPNFGGFSSLGKTTATSTVTPGFGSFGGSTGFMMGQPQMQTPQMSAEEAFAQSIFNVSIYGDERDSIIAKWNYLQAMWGTGKSFYSQTAPPVEITPQNYLCRFKAMGYSKMPGRDNKMGLVALNLNRPSNELQNQRQQIINNLNAIFGNKSNLMVNIETIKDTEEKKCQIIIYLEEKSQIAPNEVRRILATDLCNFLNQSHIKAQLTNMGVMDILALITPDEEQLKQYLENSPKGIDPRLWRQAINDNPDPTKFIPVPMVGFGDLKWRIKCQENETEMHALFLNKLGKDLSELRQRHTSATARIMENKRKLAELSHIILKIIVRQECTRKMGLALTPEEEALRTKLENMQALVSAPTQFKGRLSELLSQLRVQRNQFAQNGGNEYAIDKDSEEEMKSFLAMLQKAMEVLMDTVKKDLKSLQIIIDGMPEVIQK